MTLFNPVRTGLFLMLLLGGCNATQRPPITVDYDHAVNFSALHTYAWQESDLSGAELSGLDVAAVDSMIRTAVDRELAAKGYIKAPEGEADFWVVYDATRERTMEAVPVIEPGSSGGRADWNIGGGGGGGAPVTTEVRERDEGTVMIYIVDPKADRPIWQCLDRDVIRRSGALDERRSQIDAAVAEMLAPFPP